MTYLRAALAGLGVAVVGGAVLGVLTGVSIGRQLAANPTASNYSTVHGPLGTMGPYGGASVTAAAWAAGIATALNCAAFFALFLIPIALGAVFVKRKIRALKS